MSFFEFIDQLIYIIKNLGISFWISVILVSPLFMIFEELIQNIITKILYIVFVRFPNKYIFFQKILGFTSPEKIRELQNLHSSYEEKKTISEKLKISEDFLDETRGAMFVYNELSHFILGEIDEKSEDNESDSNYFDYDIIYKQDFSIKELKEINNSKKYLNNKIGNDYYTIRSRYSNKIVRKKVYRKKNVFNLPKEFIDTFLIKMEEVESHFLENVEMYLFQKKLSLRWMIFKIIIFIPFMFFLSELIEELLEFFEFI